LAIVVTCAGYVAFKSLKNGFNEFKRV